jgi:DNA-binding NarL/FixJ family response regulator
MAGHRSDDGQGLELSDGPGLGVLLVEDHDALRDGLQLLLEQHGHHVVGATGVARNALALALGRDPDVVVVDLGLPGEGGLELTRWLIDRRPGARILLYTASTDPQQISEALDSGALGYASKDGSRDELLEAIGEVGAGRPYLDPRLERPAIAAAARDKLLTPREREVIELLGRGLTGSEIAEELVIAPETVRSYVKAAMRKLQASTRAHAVVLALQRREIDLD